MEENESIVQNKLLLTITALGVIASYFLEFRNNIIGSDLEILLVPLDIILFISGTFFSLYLLLIFTRYTGAKNKYKLPYYFDSDLEIELDPKKVNKLFDYGVRITSVVFFSLIPFTISYRFIELNSNMGLIGKMLATLIGIISAGLLRMGIKRFLGKS